MVMPTLATVVAYYHGTDPAELRACLDSLEDQTRRADEVVLVEDGPVGTRTHEVAEDFLSRYPGASLLTLPRNVGAGPAHAAGLDNVAADFYANLDADDIAAPERFATQLEFFAAHPQYDVVGTAMREFDDATLRETGDLAQASRAAGDAVRTLPHTHEEIARYARINSPVNHPSVMIRLGALRAAGGYQDVHFLEDYDLFARLLAGGARFHNLDQPLTWFRVSPDQTARRTGKEMFAAEWELQRRLTSYGLISLPRAGLNFLLRSAYRLLPQAVLRRVYKRLFHR